MSAKLDIVVPVLDRSDHTLRLLRSVRGTYPDHRFIIVDNGSNEWHMISVLEKLDSCDVYIRNEENLGFARAVNMGLKLSDAPFVAIQNNDTLMYPEGYERLIEHASVQDTGAVGPLCNSSADSVQKMSNWPQVRGLENADEPWQELISKWSGRSCAISRLAMFCTVLPRRTLETVGLLSEDFGLAYGEDDDYSNRIIEARFRIRLALDVYVYHAQRTTAREVLGEEGIEAEMAQGRARLIEKWGQA